MFRASAYPSGPDLLKDPFYFFTISKVPFDIVGRRVVVMIAPGHVYVPEEYGWFRITFTVGKEALEEGLNRFLASIKEIEVESQDWK